MLAALAAGLAAAALTATTSEGAVPCAVVAGLVYGSSRVAVRALLQIRAITLLVLWRQPLAYLVMVFTALRIAMYATSLRRTTPSVPSAVTTVTGVVFPGAGVVATRRPHPPRVVVAVRGWASPWPSPG
ncbi:hypothetical protein QRX50_29445 [Amycolatopsis carbonis]|uniref:Uncharacterized protein n=1 Tax=Amycolatopsis carbonis TaxID=715471 RepID=A0A9Y2I9K8_9PSEU|nr:hypothetical protein [Amycolatopsis sp. 2-15]WIX75617.1 hypothetical protein QRX50_29445 [Amycolatopsis sp. 2-15]